MAHSIHQKVLRERNVESAERKGITSLLHYRALTIYNLLPSQHNEQMGMENTAISVFGEIIKEECEPPTLMEENVRTRVQTAIQTADRLREHHKTEEISGQATGHSKP
jgi:hypothetical protein